MAGIVVEDHRSRDRLADPGGHRHTLESIVDRAKRVNAALIIVGLRRHGRVDRAMNNETSLNVMRNSTCPVMGVVPELTGLPVRILATTDFSAVSLVASRTARAISGDGAALVLAYVPPVTALVGDEGERTIHDLGVRAAFETAAHELGDDGVAFDHIVLEHDTLQVDRRNAAGIRRDCSCRYHFCGNQSLRSGRALDDGKRQHRPGARWNSLGVDRSCGIPGSTSVTCVRRSSTERPIDARARADYLGLAADGNTGMSTLNLAPPDVPRSTQTRPP